MKRAVKWLSTSINRRPGRKEQDGRYQPVEKSSGRRRPDGKEQDGQRRPRKELWRQRRPSMDKVDQIKKTENVFLVPNCL